MTQVSIAARQQRSNLFWKTFFFIGLALVCLGFWAATEKTDYIWHWNRIPDFFYYTDKVDVRSEVEGEVSSIVEQGTDSLITVTGQDETETYTVPTANLRAHEGEYLNMGDVVGSYEQKKFGVMVTGLVITIEVSIVSIFFGILIGLFTGLARLSSNPALKLTAVTYIELIRGSPLLVQIILWYFVLGTLINKLLIQLGLPELPALVYAVASLTLFAGAYVAEIVRAGIQSISKGQMEAARSLGMTKPQAMSKIILPQAFKRILPPLAGQFISLIKDSSLLGVMGITELTKATREAVTISLLTYEMWFVCAILYLVITFSLSMFVRYLEKRSVD